jgi:hypothetical protein
LYCILYSIYFFLYWFVLPLLPTRCKCRGLLLNPTTHKTHTDTYSVGLLWTRDRPVAETSTWQHTTFKRDIRTPGGIRSCNPSKRTASDSRFRPRSHWDQPLLCMFVKRTGYSSSTRNSTVQPHPDCVPRQFTHVEFYVSRIFSDLNSIQYFCLKRRKNVTTLNVVCTFFFLKSLGLWSYAVCVFLLS